MAYLRRAQRNLRFRMRASDHIEFYRLVMRDDISRRTARGAVGTEAEADWLRLGALQFDFLTANGLRPDHRLLEIGCGNLRAGWRLIEFLGSGAYTGVDASPEIIVAAQRTLAERRLQHKRPGLFVVGDMGLAFLPEEHFDVVHAHSVFSHTPLEVVAAAFEGVRRVIRPDGFFDLTFNESAGGVWHVLWEDFYFPEGTLVDLAASSGFVAERMAGWQHPQAKLRLRPA
jgi:SAM-dependent methyltransferase